MVTFATDAKTLLKSCNPQEHFNTDIQTFHKTGCVFFIRGTIDAHNTFVAVRNVDPIFCPSAKLTFDSIEHIFIRWADNNQEKLDWTAADAVYAALADTFPCYQEKKK